jgi:hypothetical protein
MRTTRTACRSTILTRRERYQREAFAYFRTQFPEVEIDSVRITLFRIASYTSSTFPNFYQGLQLFEQSKVRVLKYANVMKLVYIIWCCAYPSTRPAASADFSSTPPSKQKFAAAQASEYWIRSSASSACSPSR